MCSICDIEKEENGIAYIACPEGDFYRAKPRVQMAKADYLAEYLKARNEARKSPFSTKLQKRFFYSMCEQHGINRRICEVTYWRKMAVINPPKLVGIMVIDIDPNDVISLSYPA